MNSLNGNIDTYVLGLLNDIDSEKGFFYENIAKLARVENSIILRHIKKYLESTNSDQKTTGIEILMRTHPNANYTLLIPFLEDEDPDVRLSAIQFLCRVKVFMDDFSLINLAINSLRNDSSPDVRAEVASALSHANVNLQNVRNALLWAKLKDEGVSSLGHPVSWIAEKSLERISRFGMA
ncbi:MAG: HEAT repeat domain-containing protein [Anaerolineales bacterium]|nr:HEAT repeat domain-containing protein [Anaerolineales bacterium]